MQKNVFRLFSNCISVKGNNRATICDLHRSKIYFIPNSLYYLLTQQKNACFDEIIMLYPNDTVIIKEYFDFLLNHELGFWCDSPNNFPDLNLEWDSPEIINNAIIEADNLFNQYDSIINQLIDMHCKFLEIRFYNLTDLSLVTLILEIIRKRRIRGIVIYYKFKDEKELNEISKLVRTNLRIGKFIIHSTPKHIETDNDRIEFNNQPIDSNISCGNILQNYFSVSINTFTEAQKHNTCLNRKISITADGFIKNCPSMKENYGHISNTTLKEALEHPDFKKYWYVHKDQIEVCKDCEFRYICTDCRAYIEDPDNILSKPLKCGYNPYTCEWEEWSTNPLKQKAIEYYGMKEMIKGEVAIN